MRIEFNGREFAQACMKSSVLSPAQGNVVRRIYECIYNLLFNGAKILPHHIKNMNFSMLADTENIQKKVNYTLTNIQ